VDYHFVRGTVTAEAHRASADVAWLEFSWEDSDALYSLTVFVNDEQVADILSGFLNAPRIAAVEA
jgi:hypothetical protein